MRRIKVKEAVLVVDIGNTNIVCAIYEHGKISWSVRLASDRMRPADEYYGLLCSMDKDSRLLGVKYVALGSVVPELTRIWKHLLAKYLPARVIDINGHSPLGIKYKVADPGFIGADLVANAYGAWKKNRQSAIIIDLGTATTIQVMNSKGIFEGAIIATGLKTGVANLFERAAQLSEFEMETPEVMLGTNTRDAVLSGVMNGHALMLEGFITKLKMQYFDLNPMLTILCGGMADLLKPLVPSADIVDKNLTTDGFYMAMASLI